MSPASSGQAPLPSFVIIGAERGAIRWLRFNLDRHPEVFAPPIELNWFSDVEAMRSRGRRWYQMQFDAWEGEALLGEASSTYLKLITDPEQVATRMHRSLSDARLVAILRQPVDRLESAVRMYVKRGRLPADVDVFDLICRDDPIVTELDLIGAGLYASCLGPFVRDFGEQLLVLDYAEVCEQPEKVYADVLHHIGADPSFVAPDLDRRRFADRSVVDVAALTDEQRRIVHTAFRRDIEELEALLGRDLTAWDPGPPPMSRHADVAAVVAAIPMIGPAPEPGELEPDDADPDGDADDELGIEPGDDRGEAEGPPVAESAVAP